MRDRFKPFFFFIFTTSTVETDSREKNIIANIIYPADCVACHSAGIWPCDMRKIHNAYRRSECDTDVQSSTMHFVTGKCNRFSLDNIVMCIFFSKAT